MHFNFRSVFLSSIYLISVLFLSSCAVHHITPITADKGVYKPAPIPMPDRQALYHSVAPGETLWRIAKMYDVDIDAIKRINRIRNVRDIEIGTKLYIPKAAPRKRVITLYPSRKWKYIIVHHSATDAGNSEFFNEAHKKRGWKSVGYHFIIDNGTYGKDEGQIEMTPRWIKQENGAHCKADRMNERGIGICLVGNFSHDRVSSKQMDSLVYIVTTLQEYYKIPDANVIGHGYVNGAQTECPGTRFPLSKLRARLK